MKTTMRVGSRGFLVGLIVALAVVASPVASAADEISFAFGAAFAVGGVSFQVAWTGPHPGYQPYYYRTSAPLRHSGYGCGSYCFKRGAHWFHGPSCGLVMHHFSLYGFHGPAVSFEGVYPPYYGPAPGHYLPFYGRGSHGHHHRSHGYLDYRGYGGYRSGYGHGYGYGYGRGYEQGYRRHGKRYGHGHRYGHGYRGHGYKGHGGSFRPPVHSPGRSHGHPPGAARRTRPPRP